MALADPEAKGWLLKQGQYIKNWRRRYCVLKKGILYYYLDPKQQQVPTNRFRLRGSVVEVKPENNQFELVLSSGIRRSLRAETSKERDEWLRVLNESIGFVRTRTQLVLDPQTGKKVTVEVADADIADDDVDDYDIDDELDHEKPEIE